MTFDIVVIGNGLIGSAALRHLSAEQPGLRVAAIGPDEPANRKTHTGVFASHYDQGRITRILDSDLTWGRLAARSIERYTDIEQASGIQFHHPVGCLHLTNDRSSSEKLAQVGGKLGADYESVETAKTYDYLAIDEHYAGFLERGNAGYINPRRLVQAQLSIAERQGATIIRETVSSIMACSDYVELATSAGNSYRAQKILIAAGGFTNLLLQRKLIFRLKAHTILLARLPTSEAARLAAMPALIWEVADAALPSIYLTPPIRYPDGHINIKLGPLSKGGALREIEDYIESGDDLRAWFQSDGRADVAEAVKKVLQRAIADLQTSSYDHKPCLVAYTEHGYPYVDELEQGRIFVATGGNGAAAKSSDEIGRIGAALAASGVWREKDYAQEQFAAVYQ